MTRMARCTGCSSSFPLDKFPRHPVWPDGRSPRCAPCAEKDKSKADRKKTQVRKSVYKWVLKSKYGLTERQYEEMLEEQGGVCAICGNKCTSGRTLSVDHDHSCCPGSASCGKCIRGLLCTRCNMGLGYFLDDANRLRAAVSYLSGSDSVE